MPTSQTEQNHVVKENKDMQRKEYDSKELLSVIEITKKQKLLKIK